MSYHTESLPDSIRQQVESFIEFLLWKHQQTAASSTLVTPVDQTETFLDRWTGYFADASADTAKDEYLTKKYL